MGKAAVEDKIGALAKGEGKAGEGVVSEGEAEGIEDKVGEGEGERGEGGEGEGGGTVVRGRAGSQAPAATGRYVKDKQVTLIIT